jgi:hypothetical protein
MFTSRQSNSREGNPNTDEAAKKAAEGNEEGLGEDSMSQHGGKHLPPLNGRKTGINQSLGTGGLKDLLLLSGLHDDEVDPLSKPLSSSSPVKRPHTTASMGSAQLQQLVSHAGIHSSTNSVSTPSHPTHLAHPSSAPSPVPGMLKKQGTVRDLHNSSLQSLKSLNSTAPASLTASHNTASSSAGGGGGVGLTPKKSDSALRKTGSTPHLSSRPESSSAKGVSFRAGSGKHQQPSYEVVNTTDDTDNLDDFDFDDDENKQNQNKNEIKNIDFFRICGLCEMRLPRDAIEIKVFRKHIVKLRSSWDSKLVSKEVRSLDNTISMYNLVYVCYFCAQYFDPDFNNGIAYPTRIPAAKIVSDLVCAEFCSFSYLFLFFCSLSCRMTRSRKLKKMNLFL